MIRKELRWPFWATVALLVAFTILFLVQANYEFVFYVLVVLFFLAVLIVSDKHVTYPVWLVWLLFSWAALHMAGGGVRLSGHVLYAQMLIPIVGEPYNVLKYDQVVHAFGFFVAALVMAHVLFRNVKPDYGRFAIGLAVFAAGMGLGALNEVVEFIATVIVPNTGVGGYENTALDLVSNTVGSLAAALFAVRKK